MPCCVAGLHQPTHPPGGKRIGHIVGPCAAVKRGQHIVAKRVAAEIVGAGAGLHATG